MPFLRAALIRKQKEEQKPEIIPEPISEPEPEEILTPEPEPEDIPEPQPEPEESAEAESEETPTPEPEPEETISVVEEISEPTTEPEEAPAEPEVTTEPEEIEPEPEYISENLEVVDEPEVVSVIDEDIHIPEDISDGDNIPETQEEEPEIAPEPEEPEEPEIVSESEPEPEETPEPTHKDYSGANLQYDFTSGERYVDTVSTKTEFDKMLDELAAISNDLLTHEVEKFAVKFTGKFQGDNDKAEADAKKYEAFLGGYITNAAMILYDNGYRDAAIKRLEQAKSILEARKKLEDETQAITARVEENDDSVDLSDLLGLFGD